MSHKIIIAKAGKNALTDKQANSQMFNSDYGTPKLFKKVLATLTINALGGNTSGEVKIDHNLGYYPYTEVYLQNPLGGYGYCPNFNGGASTTWTTGYRITNNQIKLFAQQSGFTLSNPTFTFIVFIFKNNLGF